MPYYDTQLVLDSLDLRNLIDLVAGRIGELESYKATAPNGVPGIIADGHLEVWEETQGKLKAALAKLQQEIRDERDATLGKRVHRVKYLWDSGDRAGARALAHKYGGRCLRGNLVGSPLQRQYEVAS